MKKVAELLEYEESVTMKRQIIIFILIFVLSTLLCACAAGTSSYEEDGAAVDTTAVEAESPKDEILDAGAIGTADETVTNTDAEDVSKQEGETVSAGFPPVLWYNSLEEALSDIKAVKAAGPEVKHNYNYDFAKVYERDHIYILETVPPQLECKQMLGIVIDSDGVRLSYSIDDGYSEDVAFVWNLGKNEEERVVEISQNFYKLEHYENTKFYFGQDSQLIRIYWWENGDEFRLSYPTETEIPPEELIDYLEVVRYDF